MIPIALLGATGAVGQKALTLLHDHPLFTVTELIASERHRGKSYGEAVVWHELSPLPERFASLPLKEWQETTAPYALSALPASIAADVELSLALRGIHLSTNASALRMHPDIPLLVPEVNGREISLLQRQKTPGKIVANPNCVVANIAPALAPLLTLAPLHHLGVVTLQAASGAGYPGVSSWDLLGNVIPHIAHEEEKIARELHKIFGHLPGETSFSVSAQVHRVAVLHGHMATLQLHYDNPVEVEEAWKVLEEQRDLYPLSYCLHRDISAPQPARHLTNDDWRVHIGQVKRGGSPQILSLVVLGHNLVRGAAGAALMNMELLCKA